MAKNNGLELEEVTQELSRTGYRVRLLEEWLEQARKERDEWVFRAVSFTSLNKTSAATLAQITPARVWQIMQRGKAS